MRLLAFILSIIVFTLSIMPCADDHECASEGNMECCINNSYQHNGATHGLDLCSPFCHCSCCGGFVLANVSTEVPVTIITFFRTTFSEFLSPNPTEIPLPVWQPPQLV